MLFIFGITLNSLQQDVLINDDNDTSDDDNTNDDDNDVDDDTNRMERKPLLR